VTKNLKWKTLLVIIIVASCIWLFYPPQERINLGLDLKGGTHLVLKVDTSNISKGARQDAVRRNLEIIRNRVDRFGVAEPLIQPQGTDRIIVDFPGIEKEESERLIKLIGRTALLEFKLVAPSHLEEEILKKIDKKVPILDKVKIEERMTGDGVVYKCVVFNPKDTNKIKDILDDKRIKELIPQDYYFSMSRKIKGSKERVHKESGPITKFLRNLFKIKKLQQQNDLKEQLSENPRELFLLKKKAEISGKSLKNAYWRNDPLKGYFVVLDFDYKGRYKLRELTHNAAKKYNEENKVSRLAIVLDDIVYSAPLMKVEVDTNPIIEGNFTKDEVKDLVLVLSEGALEAPMIKEQQTTIGPTLGRDSVKKGVKAAILGGILVLLFMGIYYLFAGLLANFALCLNIIIILGALSYFKAALTLPGIAGIILTIGMAVDANVLIFERIREELKTGKNIRFAIQGGYHKAFSTILDANLTTLITAFILYKIGTGPVRGFAVTLSIGIIASMFTALVVTRLIFDYLTVKFRVLKRLPMLQILRKENFDFISKRRIAYLLSFIVIVAGIINFSLRGEANFGVDFTGGLLQQVHFEEAPDINKVRAALSAIGLKKATIQKFGNEKDILIRTDKGSPEEVEKVLVKTFKDNEVKTVRIEKVGPTVGKELRLKALWAILLAMIAICIYITVRFEFKFAIGALIALFHDVLVTLGIYSIAQRELSLPIIAAILTIIGYSLNDTIVVFDRIREDLGLMTNKNFKDIVNTSINQTLSRTLITSFTTLIVVLSLYFLGGSVINDFALVLLIGIIVGTYSSIFVAAPILVEWHKRS